MKLFLLCLGTTCGLSTLSAELTLPHFFSDHMVVQREKPIEIWGTTDPKGAIVISFKGKITKTTADDQGAWRATLSKERASSGGRDLTVTSGKFNKVIKDVLVGEVWFASGQSNMAFTVSGSHEAEADIAKANNPAIRMFLAELTPAAEPQSDIGGTWQLCTSANVPRWSATAYFFARKLHKELGVPIGVIKSAWGGKPVETFTSREALNSVPEGKAMMAAFDEAAQNYDAVKSAQELEPKLDNWEKRIARYNKKKKAGEKVGRRPRKPTLQRNPAATAGQPAVLYNGMIHPFVGYTMRGAIWYQGEANAKTGKAGLYQKMFSLMITDWRTRWNDDFSFLWVQLANFRAPATEPGANDLWALLQDEQRKTLALPKTGMAVCNDIGAANNIHPKNKKDVGARLALWALKHDYGKDLLAHGPLYKEHKIVGGKVHLSFDYANGLKARGGGPLKRFEIAGADRKWHWADADIQGGSIVVSSSKVSEPAAVRYAWCSNPEGANLVNSEGLPASVFRTDDWKIEGQ